MLRRAPPLVLVLVLVLEHSPAHAALPTDLVPQKSLESALLEAAQSVCPDVKVAFEPDLMRAARLYVNAVRDGKADVTGQALAHFASLEAFDPSPVAGLATTDIPGQADRAVGDLFPRSCRYDRVGVAGAKISDTLAVVAVLAAARTVQLQPIPGRLDELSNVPIVGQLMPGLANARLYHTKPDGSVEEQALQAGKERRFSGSVRLIETGEHSVEVLADGSGGPQVVALRRVFVGIDPPKTPPPPLPVVSGNGLAAVEQSIAQLRKSRGLTVLVRDPALDAVAEAHSKLMAKARIFAHVLPQEGNLADRLDKAGYARLSSGENIGLAEDALTAHEAVAQSPAHLFNLLDPRHRRLGLGAVLGPSPDGTQAVYLTEVMAAPAVILKDPAGEVARLLLDARAKKKLPPLKRDARLDALAATEVKSAARASAFVLPGNEFSEKMMDAAPDLSSANAELMEVGTAEECADPKSLSDAAWTHLGVGTTYAPSKHNGPGRLWVLLIFAR